MLPLAALTDSLPTSFAGYDGFHLVIGTVSSVVVLSWDGVLLVRRELAPGDHIIVNVGVDATEDPLVPHFAPLLAALPDPPLTRADAVTGLAGAQPTAGPDALSSTLAAWGPWLELMRGDGLPPDDPRALLLYTEIDGRQPGMEEYAGRIYGSGSEALVALAPGRVRYDFTPTPFTPAWRPILPPALA